MTRKKRFKLIAVLLVCAGVLLGGVLWVRFIRPLDRELQSVRHLQMIAIALDNYHGKHGCYPPAYTVDDQGNRMHSWRVLILPELELQTLYDRYDFSEPWNGPHNRLLAAEMPEVFRSGCDESDSTLTHFLAVVGEETVWPGSKSVKQSDFRDGTSDTITLIEAGNEAVPWLEPRDLSFDQLKNGFAHGNESGIRGTQPDRVLVAFGAAGIRWLPANISAQALQAALTIAGGERLGVSETGEFTLYDEEE